MFNLSPDRIKSTGMATFDQGHLPAWNRPEARSGHAAPPNSVAHSRNSSIPSPSTEETKVLPIGSGRHTGWNPRDNSLESTGSARPSPRRQSDWDYTPRQNDFPAFTPSRSSGPQRNGHTFPTLAQLQAAQATAGVQEQDPFIFTIGQQASSGNEIMVKTLAAMHAHNVQLQQELLGIARQTGRLERERDTERYEKETQTNRAEFYKAESIRLRSERDMERMALASLRQQLAESSISSSYENISAPLLGNFGDMISSLESLPLVEGGEGTMDKYVHPFGASWLQDNGSSSALSMADSTHSLGSFLQYSYPTATEIYTHFLPPIFNIKDTKLYLNGLFIGTETWGGIHATLPVSAVAATADIVELKQCLRRVCKASRFNQVDELLDILYRRYVVSAMIIEHFLPLLGPGLFQHYSSQSDVELEAIRSELAYARTSALSQCHGYLERRAEIFRTIIETPAFNEWKDKQIMEKTTTMLKLLSLMVPTENQQLAIHDLERLVRECYGIAQQLAVFPCEWYFEQALRDDIWNPDTMIIRDPSLSSKNKWVEGRAIVRLGIQPSVFDQDYSTGEMVPTEHYRKIVLLMERKSSKQPNPEKKFKS